MGLVSRFAQKDNISVFPNPVINTVKFTGLKPGDKISIYSLLGQIIYETTTNSEEYELDNIELETGIYIYTVKSIENKTKIGKLVKY